MGFVVTASVGSSCAAVAVFFHFGKNAVYKFGATDESRQELRANNLIIWEGIRFLSQNGASTLHFGRTSFENDGLRRFKLTWGSQEERIMYFKFDSLARTWVKRRDASLGFHEVVFARLPLVLNRVAGTVIYPHLD